MIARSLSVATLAAFMAASAFSQLSPELRDWPRGPVQWFMTREDQAAWKKLKSDDEAKNFIDLFWARRDPTPGTPRNEFREEFNWRVKEADEKFSQPPRIPRGSLSDRGRVLVTLGYPTNLSSTGGAVREGSSGVTTLEAGNAPSAAGPTGQGRNVTEAVRDTWLWERADAAKYDMPRIEVVFVRGDNGIYQRDPHRPDVMAAMPNAVKKAIKNPELKEVPGWAKIVTLASTPAEAAAIAAPPPLPVASARPAGVHGLFLLKEIALVQDAQSGVDPFASITGSDPVFTRNDELGYTFEYCLPMVDMTAEPVLNVAIWIHGEINGEKINMRAPAEEVSPERIKKVPGCYMVRGGVPLSEMDPGDYTFTLTVEEPVSKQSYNLEQSFRVE